MVSIVLATCRGHTEVTSLDPTLAFLWVGLSASTPNIHQQISFLPDTRRLLKLLYKCIATTKDIKHEPKSSNNLWIISDGSEISKLIIWILWVSWSYGQWHFISDIVYSSRFYFVTFINYRESDIMG